MKPTRKHPLTQQEFNDIYAKVPRLTVEIIVKNSESAIYLTQRAIEPCKGQWHLPGGTVRFGERLLDAVRRIARRELGIHVSDARLQGYIEYPSHYEQGLDSPVGMVFEVTNHAGNFSPNEEASTGGWFNQLPPNMHADQDEFLLKIGFIESRASPGSN